MVVLGVIGLVAIVSFYAIPVTAYIAAASHGCL